MSKLADQIVKGSWHAEIDCGPFDAGDPNARLEIGAVGADAVFEVRLGADRDVAMAKVRVALAIPGMVAALRAGIAATRELGSDADTPEGMDIARNAIVKMEDALRSAGLSVPL